MASRKTWIWALAGLLAAGLVVLIVAAGAGVYYVSRHVHSERTSGADAIRTFDRVLEQFGESRPLYELDRSDEPRPTVTLSALPSSDRHPEQLWVLAWDTDQGRIIRLSLPFWMLRVGKQKFNLSGSRHGAALEHLDLDLAELERIGPALVFDYRDPEGNRVLLWTE